MTTSANHPTAGTIAGTRAGSIAGAGPVRNAAAIPRERRRVSLVDSAVLGLIAVVVVLVSLPRLRRFALHENELDAIRMVRLLAEDALAHPDALASAGLPGLLASSSGHRVRLEDVEVLRDGRLRRHGYVFECVFPGAGPPAILAWPWEHGETGLGAFGVEPGGATAGHPNEDGRYSGSFPPPIPFRGGAGDLEPEWIALAAD